MCRPRVQEAAQVEILPTFADWIACSLLHSLLDSPTARYTYINAHHGIWKVRCYATDASLLLGFVGRGCKGIESVVGTRLGWSRMRHCECVTRSTNHSWNSPTYIRTILFFMDNKLVALGPTGLEHHADSLSFYTVHRITFVIHLELFRAKMANF
jgi:hypothetical protein